MPAELVCARTSWNAKSASAARNIPATSFTVLCVAGSSAARVCADGSPGPENPDSIPLSPLIGLWPQNLCRKVPPAQATGGCPEYRVDDNRPKGSFRLAERLNAHGPRDLLRVRSAPPARAASARRRIARQTNQGGRDEARALAGPARGCRRSRI